MNKRLYRSKSDRMLFGVCGGLGDYFEIDPVIVRLLFVALAFGGVGFVIYIIAIIIIPEEQDNKSKAEIITKSKDDKKDFSFSLNNKSSNGELIFALILLLLGVGFLMQNIFPWFKLGNLWPLVLIILGIAILMRHDRKGE